MVINTAKRAQYSVSVQLHSRLEQSENSKLSSDFCETLAISSLYSSFTDLRSPRIEGKSICFEARIGVFSSESGDMYAVNNQPGRTRRTSQVLL
jgi:hypothetical protein